MKNNYLGLLIIKLLKSKFLVLISFKFQTTDNHTHWTVNYAWHSILSSVFPHCKPTVLMVYKARMQKTWKFKLGGTVVLFSTYENGRAIYRDNTCCTFFVDSRNETFCQYYTAAVGFLRSEREQDFQDSFSQMVLQNRKWAGILECL